MHYNTLHEMIIKIQLFLYEDYCLSEGMNENKCNLRWCAMSRIPSIVLPNFSLFKKKSVKNSCLT